MKKILIPLLATAILAFSQFASAYQSYEHVSPAPVLKPANDCYKSNGRLKPNRVIWNGQCYRKPSCGLGRRYAPSLGQCVSICGDGYIYDRASGGCAQNNGGGE